MYEDFCKKFSAFKQTITARESMHEPKHDFLYLIISTLLRRYYFLYEEETSAISLVIEIGFGYLRKNHDTIDQQELRLLLLSLISDLNLLITLSDHGFKLDVVPEEWIWSVSIKLEKLPDQEFLQLIELSD